MPTMRRQYCAPTYMIAEKAADLTCSGRCRLMPLGARGLTGTHRRLFVDMWQLAVQKI